MPDAPLTRAERDALRELHRTKRLFVLHEFDDGTVAAKDQSMLPRLLAQVDALEECLDNLRRETGPCLMYTPEGHHTLGCRCVRCIGRTKACERAAKLLGESHA